MSDTSIHSKPNAWIFAFILSIAVNGLLIGFLMANNMGPQKAHMKNARMKNPAPLSSVTDHPHKLLRRLDPKRRREIMALAMKQSRIDGLSPHHAVMKDLRQARRQTFALLQSPDLDAKALQAQLKKTRELKDKLGRHGDALVLEIFKQLTPEERKTIRKPRRKGNRKTNQKP